MDSKTARIRQTSRQRGEVSHKGAWRSLRSWGVDVVTVTFELSDNRLTACRRDQPLHECARKVHISRPCTEESSGWIKEWVGRVIVSAFVIDLKCGENVGRCGQRSIAVRERVFLQARSSYQSFAWEGGKLVIPPGMRVCPWHLSPLSG